MVRRLNSTNIKDKYFCQILYLSLTIHQYQLYNPQKYERKRMTDMTKYKNVSLSKETYRVLESLQKVILPEAKLSVAKTIEAIANEKAKKLNGKLKKS